MFLKAFFSSCNKCVTIDLERNKERFFEIISLVDMFKNQKAVPLIEKIGNLYLSKFILPLAMAFFSSE